MKINKGLGLRLYNVLMASKKVSRLNFNEAEFGKYINTINAINALGEDCFEYQDIPLSKWEVANVCSEFILPGKVSLSGARSDVDLLVRHDNGDDEVLNLTNFLDISSLINSSLKIELNQMTSAEALRGHVNISTVGFKQMIEGRVKDGTTNFFPMEFTTAFIKEQWVNYSAEDMVCELYRSKLRGNK
jgi:hypothetical protein